MYGGELILAWHFWIILCLLFVCFYMIRTFFFEERAPETASAAIVMAVGIFLNGAFDRLHMIDTWGPYLTIGLFLIWVFIVISFIRLLVRKKLIRHHLSEPIQSFAAGTWVAGTAVCAIVIAKYIPEFIVITHMMAVFALFLWLYYATLSIRNFMTIYRNKLYRNIHGVVLLSTVSTQSLVILYKTLYTNFIPIWVFSAWIIVGISFYGIGFFMIIKRYVLAQDWNESDGWPNTNCILHGALSITGLAIVISGALSMNVALLLWLCALAWFIMVECLECRRAYLRIRQYGWGTGVGQYDVSQWSRNFTFGMLYAFTFYLDLSKTALDVLPSLDKLKNMILDYGIWLVLLLLIVQISLFLKQKLTIRSFPWRQDQSMNVGRSVD